MVQLINVNYQTGVPAQLLTDPTVPGIIAAQFDSDPTAAGVIQVALVSDPSLSPTKYILAAGATAAPQLGGSVQTFTANQSINLTNLAGIDWAAFGYTAGPTSIERKATGGSKISALTQIGTATFNNFNYGSGGPPVWFSTWTGDGTPDASVSNEGYAVFCSVAGGQGPGPGFSFTVPADTTLRTVVVYGEIDQNAGAQALLTATLSDGSAGPYTDNSVSGAVRTAMAYTITYRAGAPSQSLTVKLTNNSANSQNVTIFAATLS